MTNPEYPEGQTEFRPPVSRHLINNVKQNTYAKEMNTVIEPTVDVTGDVAAINAGQAEYFVDSNGVGNFAINSRIYGVHSDTGTLYPISGVGFHQLDRGAFKALGVYNKFGDTPRATEILNNMGINSEQRDAALNAWRAGQRR